MLAFLSNVGAPRASRLICPLLACLRIGWRGLSGACSPALLLRLFIDDCLRKLVLLLDVLRLLRDGWRRGDAGSGLETRLGVREVLMRGVVAPLVLPVREAEAVTCCLSCKLVIDSEFRDDRSVSWWFWFW